MRELFSVPLMDDREALGLITGEVGVDDEAGFGALMTEKGALPLRSVEVNARIAGLIAHVELKQAFHNNLAERVEATYVFPLPSRAAVTGFRMEVGGRTIEGILKEREKARAEYTQAIEQGHRAAITEEERPGTFSMRCGNLLPNESALLTLTMAAPLPYADGEATFRFPLLVAPRYLPGVPLPGPQVGDGVDRDTDQVPDASRISPPVMLPGFPSPVQLRIEVEIDGLGAPISNVWSSLHAVKHSLTREAAVNGQWGGEPAREDAPLDDLSGETVHKISLQPQGPAPDGRSSNTRIDRDFILRWALGDVADVSTSVAISWDMPPPVAPSGESDKTADAIKVADKEGSTAEGDIRRSVEGTFQLVVVPPRDTELTTGGKTAAQTPRNVVFVLDRSGSMGGWQMVAARRATARMLETLTPRDRFAVLAFDHSIETPSRLSANELSPATDRNRAIAAEFLRGVDARGGTEMAPPLERAADLLTANSPGGRKGLDESRDGVLVLVTDGQVGNEDFILRELKAKLGQTVRIFTLGIDRNVNEGFLKRLAGLGRGQCLLVESEQRLDEAMAAINRSIGTPLLTDIAVESTLARASGLEIVPGSVVPTRIPDLFQGVPVFISGRVRKIPTNEEPPPSGAGLTQSTPEPQLSVHGTTAAGGTEWAEQVPLATISNEAFGSLWARAKIRELEDKYVASSRLFESEGSTSSLEEEIVATSLRFRVLSRFTAFLAVDRSEKVNTEQALEKVIQPVESARMHRQPVAFQASLGAGTCNRLCFASAPISRRKMMGSSPSALQGAAMDVDFAVGSGMVQSALEGGPQMYMKRSAAARLAPQSASIESLVRAPPSVAASPSPPPPLGAPAMLAGRGAIFWPFKSGSKQKQKETGKVADQSEASRQAGEQPAGSRPESSAPGKPAPASPLWDLVKQCKATCTELASTAEAEEAARAELTSKLVGLVEKLTELLDEALEERSGPLADVAAQGALESEWLQLKAGLEKVEGARTDGGAKWAQTAPGQEAVAAMVAALEEVMEMVQSLFQEICAGVKPSVEGHTAGSVGEGQARRPVAFWKHAG